MAEYIRHTHKHEARGYTVTAIVSSSHHLPWESCSWARKGSRHVACSYGHWYTPAHWAPPVPQSERTFSGWSEETLTKKGWSKLKHYALQYIWYQYQYIGEIYFTPLCSPFPCPLLSSNKSPLSVPTRRLTPHSAPHKISPLNLRLYLRISGLCGTGGLL